MTEDASRPSVASIVAWPLQLDHALYCARGWVKPPSLTWTGLP